MYAPDFDGVMIARKRSTLHKRLVNDIFNQDKHFLVLHLQANYYHSIRNS